MLLWPDVVFVAEKKEGAVYAVRFHSQPDSQTLPYRVQSSSCQDSFRSSRNTPAIPLQVPHDSPPVKLREHGNHLLNML